MEATWLERLRSDDIILMDGGTGSELQRRGIAMSPIAWSGVASADSCTTLRDIHADYIRAGADIVTTNTFATTRFVLEAAGFGEEFEAINRRAIGAAVEARDTVAGRPVAIAGSISCLPPGFDVAGYPPPEVELEAYRELAVFLARSGVDLIALEMLQDAEHGLRALAAAQETGLPVCLGVSARRAGARLACYDYPEEDFEAVVRGLVELAPKAVSVMHTPPDDVGAALEAVKRAWHGPLGAYPELGDFAAPNWRFSDAVSPATLVELAVGWVGQGVRLLGGCCGTGPEHIAALAAARPRLLEARRERTAL